MVRSILFWSATVFPCAPERLLPRAERSGATPLTPVSMYQKTDELVDRVTATESAVSKLNADMTSVKEVTAEVRWKRTGLALSA
ncbi:DUF1515 family protein [Mesorhizobium salmacidum]|uniref:DUF1515 family protein n=1 Tax=Mesorhizobium salmacidum TaxID=3015171 RepID=A0ABU8L771_9HYPH